LSPMFHCQKLSGTAVPGRVCAAAYRRGWPEGAKTSPAMRTVTGLAPVLATALTACGYTVTVSPTARPLSVRNTVLTSTSPGAAYQWPEISAYPIQEDGPANTSAWTSRAKPTTLTWPPYSASRCAAPGAAFTAAVAAASWAVLGSWFGPAPGLSWKTWTCTVAARVWASRAWPSEECSPTAKITAVAPNATAARVTAVRAGRANGAARPRLTGRGSRSRAASRCTAYPRPAPGARPAAIAVTADSRPARSAGPRAASRVMASMPAGARTSAHSGACWLPTP